MKIFRPLAVAAILALAVSAVAQSSKTPAADVFGGYSFLRLQGGTNMHGWGGEVAVTAIQGLSIVGEAGGNYWSNSGFKFGMHHFLVGPRITMEPNEPARPFGHILFGLGRLHSETPAFGGIPATSSDQNGFAMALGGGMDVTWKPSISVRVIQVDYLFDRFNGSTSNNIRLQAGIVFRLGSRK